jgi:uncharacterized membrane protein YeiH
MVGTRPSRPLIHVHPSVLLVRTLNLIGTLVFAMSGAARGVQRSMDLFGILVLAFVTAVSGGITRDILIGAVPPESIASWHSLALAVLGGLLVFRFSRLFDRLQHPVLLFDAIGLGLFAVTGTQKALDYGLNWPMAAILGMVSGIGGGMVRDVLTAQVPSVLRSDLYAVAALAGALVVVAGDAVHLPLAVVGWAGVAICVFLRLMALYRGWRLPAASPKGE